MALALVDPRPVRVDSAVDGLTSENGHACKVQTAFWGIKHDEINHQNVTHEEVDNKPVHELTESLYWSIFTIQQLQSGNATMQPSACPLP